MSRATVDLAASFRRLREQGFAARFYAELLQADPRIQPLFRHTDFRRQRELFEHGVLMAIDYAHGGALGGLALKRLATLHGPSGLAIPVDLFAVWRRIFLEVGGALDPQWSPELAAAWERALDAALSCMAAGA